MARTVSRQTKIRLGLPLQAKLLGGGVILDLIFLITKYFLGLLMKQIPAKDILDLLNLLDHWLKSAITVVSIFLIIFLTLWLLSKYFLKKYFDPYYLLLRNKKFDFWLQSVGLYIPLDQDNILLPNIRRIKPTDSVGIGIGAFEVEILADFKEKMLLLDESINVYLAQNHSEFHVIESYENNGWARYMISRNFVEDQLRGDDLGL